MANHIQDAVPVGEGWTRHTNELLVHPPSQVYFAQRGEQRGKYLVKADDGGWAVCPAPHVGTDYPIDVRAAVASSLRSPPPGPEGAAPAASAAPARADADRKLERAVVIAEMPKTARLALRFPLGFLDSPAAAYALFSGIRGSAAAAQWCASQFHQRLLPEIAKKIHGWWDSEAEMPEELLYRGSHVGSLAAVLQEHLRLLDRDLLAGPHGFGGCDAAIAVLVGENLVVAAAGQASVTLLFDDAEPIALLPLVDTPEEADETNAGNVGESGGVAGSAPPAAGATSHRSRVLANGALVSPGGLIRTAKAAWDAAEVAGAAAAEGGDAPEDAVARILRSPDAFTVLGFPPGAPETAAEVRTTYKRLALRVHPDKVRDCDPADAKAAFERLEAAAKAVEALMEHDSAACQELSRVLRHDPLTSKGAMAILHMDADSTEQQVDKALEKAKAAFAKITAREAEKEVQRGIEACIAAVETLRILRNGSTPGSAGERLMAVGVGGPSLSALGMRDLRGIGGKLQVRTASWRVGESFRVALCCGATAELKAAALDSSARLFRWQPKAAALQWTAEALAASTARSDSSASAICVCLRERLDENGEVATAVEDAFGVSKPVKKQKVAPGPKSVRVRHLLLRCAEPGKAPLEDPMARRPRPLDPSSPQPQTMRSPTEAEAELVGHLKGMLAMQAAGSSEAELLMAFRKLCQQHSECSSADSAGQLCGDLGWISRGQGEVSFELAAFSLRKSEISDVIATSRGVHLVQRIA